MPLETFDNRHPEFASGISTYYDTSTGSGVASQTRNWNIIGDGLIIPTCYHRTDATYNYGTSITEIKLNNITQVRNYNRLTSSIADEAGSCCTVALQVKNGDTLTMYQRTTKEGGKTFHWYILCIGCTVELI